MRGLAWIALGFLFACGGDNTPVIDAAVVDGGPVIDAVDCDGGCAGVNEVCGTSSAALDAGALPCAPGLACCYPCGIPDCLDRCTVPCSPPGPGCQEGGCPGPFP